MDNFALFVILLIIGGFLIWAVSDPSDCSIFADMRPEECRELTEGEIEMLNGMTENDRVVAQYIIENGGGQ